MATSLLAEKWVELLPNPYVFGAHKWVEWLRNPCILGCP